MASWRNGGWISDVDHKAPEIAKLVKHGSNGCALLTILSAFRNTIHAAMPSLLTYQQNSQQNDTLVALPSVEPPTVVEAMDALGGRVAWGVDEAVSASLSDTFISPGVYVEQLLHHATHLLNALLNATPVELLSGVNLQPSDWVPLTKPNSPDSGQTAQYIRWQLGL